MIPFIKLYLVISIFVTYICYMINNKHKNASQDYTKAYDLVSNTKINQSVTVKADSIKTFRKYLSDLSKYAKCKFVTRTNADNSLKILRIE